MQTKTEVKQILHDFAAKYRQTPERKYSRRKKTPKTSFPGEHRKTCSEIEKKKKTENIQPYLRGLTIV